MLTSFLIFVMLLIRRRLFKSWIFLVEFIYFILGFATALMITATSLVFGKNLVFSSTECKICAVVLQSSFFTFM